MVPVKGAGLGEVGVRCAWVGGVADECVNPCFVRGEPAGVEVADYRGGVNEIAPVEALVLGLRLIYKHCSFSYFMLHCICLREERNGGGWAAYW